MPFTVVGCIGHIVLMESVWKGGILMLAPVSMIRGIMGIFGGCGERQ